MEEPVLRRPVDSRQQKAIVVEDEKSAPAVEAILDRLRNLRDLEIPLNVVDLVLIPACHVLPSQTGGRSIVLGITMTAPGFGMGELLQAAAAERLRGIPGVDDVEILLVLDPPWDGRRMSEAGRLQLGIL
ncbi:iron-sulfur cluster assembly protein [Aciditerrimonas ferrireducens]|uniref:Iron-sulfur cluster assembly protein n=1 Tax=Aciditerrimonas ferrireducens TaxID=667306 RepID=A0ABV6C0L2_9ACTN